VKGGAVYMDHHLELSRQITNSFGFVKIPGYPNVDVYWENQLTGSTNKQGYVMIPNLLAFQKTKVNIDPSTVPLNTQIDSYEHQSAPYRNSGVLIAFDVKNIHNLIMTLKQTTGVFVPEGAAVSLEGSEEPFVVGTGGQLYISGAKEQNKGTALWESGSCTFSYTAPKADPNNPFPSIGDVTCQSSANQVQNNSQETVNNVETKPEDKKQPAAQ